MGVIEVLYNSDYAFSERLYGELDVEICCVRLHQPLQQLVQTSQPYVWNKIPRRSFQGLMCISEVQCRYYKYSVLAVLYSYCRLPNYPMLLGQIYFQVQL